MRGGAGGQCDTEGGRKEKEEGGSGGLGEEWDDGRSGEGRGKTELYQEEEGGEPRVEPAVTLSEPLDELPHNSAI